MNRRLTITFAGSLIALFLGLAVAYPLFTSSFPSFAKLDLNVDVDYAYIQPMNGSSNLTGLVWNNSVVETNYGGGLIGGATQADGLVVSYLVVMNVTNNSDQEARIRNFVVILGPYISAGEDGSLSVVNPLLTDSRHYSYLWIGDNEVWGAHSSKLIGLSGVTGVRDAPYASLNNSRSIFVYGSAEGQVANSNSAQQATSYSLKQVSMKSAGNG